MPPNSILVLGHKLTESGQLSDDLVKRLDLAIQIYDTLQGEKRILCSGGYPYNQQDNGVYEAVEMKKYLTTNNIPDRLIFTETTSRETVGNIVFSLKMILERGEDLTSLHIVSSQYHIPRIQTLVNKIKESASRDISYHGSYSTYGHTSEEQTREKKVIKLYEHIFPEVYTIQQIENMMKQNIIGYTPTPIWTPEKIQDWLEKCEV